MGLPSSLLHRSQYSGGGERPRTGPGSSTVGDVSLGTEDFNPDMPKKAKTGKRKSGSADSGEL